jgi:hypothetical protein
MTYQGTLRYLDWNDSITIHRFSVSAEEITFRLTTTWGTLGEWELEDVAKADGETYTCKAARATQGDMRAKPGVVAFRIKPDGDALQVSGVWVDGGEEYAFSGTLAADAAA